MHADGATAPRQTAAFDRMLDIIAEELVEQYIAEIEVPDGSDEVSAPHRKETTA